MINTAAYPQATPVNNIQQQQVRPPTLQVDSYDNQKSNTIDTKYKRLGAFDLNQGNEIYNIYGFQRNMSLLSDCFKFNNLSFQNVPETPFKHINLQNGRVWALTERNDQLIKYELDSQEKSDIFNNKADIIDDSLIKKKRIKQIFLDREGIHGILASDYEIFYNNWNDNVVLTIGPTQSSGQGHSKGQEYITGARPRAIRSIDIYHDLGEHNLFEIVLATEDGQIFHAVLEYQNKKLIYVEEFECLVDLPDSRPIIDIKIASLGYTSNIILAITESSLYQFSGESNIRGVLQSYRGNAQLISKNVLTLEANIQSVDQARTVSEQIDDFGNIQLPIGLQIFFDYKQKHIPLGFGWYHESRFCYSEFKQITRIDDITKCEETVLKTLTQEDIRPNVINYVMKKQDKLEVDPIQKPIAFVITQFNILFIYPQGNITVLSTITQEIVFSTNIEMRLKRAFLDMMNKNLVFLGQKEKNVDTIEYCILNNEEKNAWRLYLKKGQIKRALQVCEEDQKTFIAGIYADQLFQEKKYSEAAEYYSKSKKTFEEVSLRFIKEGLFSNLIEYLEHVLEQVTLRPDQEQFKPQKLLLCTWIVELKLNELSNIEAARENSSGIGGVGGISEKEKKQLQIEYQNKMEKFKKFLEKTMESKNAEAIIQMLQSHGKIDECISYAEKAESYDTVIVHYINKQEHGKALEKLVEIKEEQKRYDTLYRYASILLNKCADKTLNMLKKKEFKKIDVDKLMPAFMNIQDEKDQKLALEYINAKRQTSKAKSVHNMAFFFNSRLQDATGVIQFLETEEINKSQGRAIHFEVDYALNICKQKEKELLEELNLKRTKAEMKSKSEQQYSQNSQINPRAAAASQQKSQDDINETRQKILVMKKAQIIIYAILNHFDKAVKISLECGDVEMAKKWANKPEDHKIKKKLWMKIAKYLFGYQGKRKNKTNQFSLFYDDKSNDPHARKVKINEALKILDDSKLKIDDLLPLFPPDEKVQDLKEHLCRCLKDYKDKIERLKDELDDLSKNAEVLRTQHRKQKHKYITIAPSQTCDLCFKSIFDKEFYVFPCLHAFHRVCIQNKLANYKTKDVTLKVIIDKLKSNFSQIDAIKENAQYLAMQSDGQGKGQGSFNVGGIELNSEGYLGNFAGGISNLVQRGAGLINATGVQNHLLNRQNQSNQPGFRGVDSTIMHAIREQDKIKIRERLEEIDRILCKECLFCGQILIDMVDHSIYQPHINIGESENVDEREFEGMFGQRSEVKEEKDEWDIE